MPMDSLRFPKLQLSARVGFSLGPSWFIDKPSYFRQIDDTVSWAHGKHDIQTGIMINYQKNGVLAYP